MYTEIWTLKGEKDAIQFTNELIISLFLFCTVIVAVVIFFTEPIIQLFASGFSGETLHFASSLTRVGIVSVYFITFSYVLTGYLHAKQKFLVVSMIGIPLNIINILFIYLSRQYDYILLGYGQVFASLLQVLVLLFAATKCGFFMKLTFNNLHFLRKMYRNIIPVTLGKSINQINKLVDRTIASSVVIGGISALSYANRLNLLLQGIIILPFSTVMYSVISRMVADKNDAGIVKTTRQYLIAVLILVIPVSFGGILMSEDIITLIYGRGAFNAAAIQMTSLTFAIYQFGIVGLACREIFSNVFYSYQDTKTPMINSIIGLILNVVLNIVLSKYFGLTGIALASSITISFIAIMMYFKLSREVIKIGNKALLQKLFKILLSSLSMLVVVYFLRLIIPHEITLFLKMLILVSSGAVSYIFLLSLLKVEEITIIYQLVKRKTK